MPDYNLFMMCEKLQREALIEIPDGYHIRPCRQDELSIWKGMPFDDIETAIAYDNFMQEYYDVVYKPKEDLFFQRCLYICDEKDNPVGTAFIWPSYNKINTLHWFKIIKSYEDKKLGRALLSFILGQLKEADFPIYLHTQPGSYRAIKLYSDFGFKLITDTQVGPRYNYLKECLPLLEREIPLKYFSQLKMTEAPTDFLDTVASYSHDEF